MYAAYQLNDSSRQTIRATSVANSDDSILDLLSGAATFQDRILHYCTAGTFGLLTPMYLRASSATANWNINKIEFEGAQIVEAEALSSVASDIKHIRHILKISVTELSNIFGVSRQAVHEWIKGGTLSPRNAYRLSEFARAADVFLESGIDMTPAVIRRKVSGGQSLLDSVREGGNVIDMARSLVDTLSRETQQRQRLSSRLEGRQKPTKANVDFETLHLRDDA